ncbi:GGDEF domain-containing protein [Neptunicella sp. SCSIO 80796]|uniref:GGDEF domain-containing protein n=1 Tax=Neptunicella plasticusilytica TaxID=3117012 RepID=UPI003A4E485E
MKGQLTQNLQHRRDVMRLLLLITFFGGCVFSVINFYRGLMPLAILEISYGLFSLVLLRIVPTTANLHKWILVYLLPFFTIMMYALARPNASEAIFAWILTIPVISYLLMGRKHGFWCSAFFIVIGISVFHWRFMDKDIGLNIATSLNVILSSCLMMTFAHIYERNREQNEERLIELAGTDRLTGLANRMKLTEAFQHLSAYAKRHQSPLVMVLIDLDYFKNINDQYGHHVGDLALCHVADFLKARVRQTDILARFGGEEFALLMVGASLRESYQQVDSLRQQLMQTPLLTEQTEILINFSAGIAIFGDDGMELNELLAKADNRLYLAKRNGRNQVVAQDQI